MICFALFVLLGLNVFDGVLVLGGDTVRDVLVFGADLVLGGDLVFGLIVFGLRVFEGVIVFGGSGLGSHIFI